MSSELDANGVMQAIYDPVNRALRVSAGPTANLITTDLSVPANSSLTLADLEVGNGITLTLANTASVVVQ